MATLRAGMCVFALIHISSAMRLKRTGAPRSRAGTGHEPGGGVEKSHANLMLLESNPVNFSAQDGVANSSFSQDSDSIAPSMLQTNASSTASHFSRMLAEHLGSLWKPLAASADGASLKIRIVFASIALAVFLMSCCCCCAIGSWTSRRKALKAANGSAFKGAAPKSSRNQYLRKGQLIYEWDQTDTRISLYLTPPNSIPKENFEVAISTRKLELGQKGKTPFLTDELFADVDTTRSSWKFSQNGELQVHMQKSMAAEWPYLVLKHAAGNTGAVSFQLPDADLTRSQSVL